MSTAFFSDTMTGRFARPSMRITAAEFANPIYDGADPFVVRHGEIYYSIRAGRGGHLEVWKSDSMLELGERAVVWSPPKYGWNRAEVWAPELHFIQGHWYIYYAASTGRNETHRMGVLKSVSDDPQGAYVDLGQMYTGDDIVGRTNNRWAIDGVPLELNGRLYFVWSGWEGGRDLQHLYVARMSDPATICSSRVRLAENNCHEWEHVAERRSERGLHEGPAFLHRHGRVFLIYSCSGSWESTYKLGMLSMSESDDPTDPASWTKHDSPVLDATDDVIGVGHCSFTTSIDGSEDWILFHSKKSRSHGWDRHIHAQPFFWTADGRPDFGRPLSSGERIPTPSTRRMTRKAA